MNILTFSPEVIDSKTFSAIIEESFKGSGDARLENWFNYEEMMRNIKLKRGVCYFICLEEKICGVIYAQVENPINGKEGVEKWIINLLAVLPDYRKRGIGKKLVMAIEETAKSNGAVKIFVATNEADSSAQLFYLKLGYRFAGSVQEYQYGLNNTAVFFLKNL